ncbi:MAG: hypothetical protein JRE36_02740 [Deltaproteobacteria bacterium]|nr:hypothetical protein [Deltaproteobacteria bacterium]
MILDSRYSILDNAIPHAQIFLTFIQYRVSSIEYRLYPITTNICQFIFDVIINPFLMRRQRIFCAADPAAQTDSLSGPLYLKLRLTL